MYDPIMKIKDISWLDVEFQNARKISFTSLYGNTYVICAGENNNIDFLHEFLSVTVYINFVKSPIDIIPMFEDESKMHPRIFKFKIPPGTIYLDLEFKSNAVEQARLDRIQGIAFS